MAIEGTVRKMALFAALTFSALAWAQEYPSRPVKLVVSVPPGGSVDSIGRLMAEKLRQALGQPFVVDNRPGASSNVGLESVYRAEPDGYTLLFSPGAPLVINKSLFAKLAFDPEALLPVSIVATNPVVLISNPKLPAESIQQLIDTARANPGRVTFASGGSGGMPHLSAELFQSMAGVRMLHVPYKGVAPAMTGLLGGQVDLMFVDISTALPHVRSGKLRVLAVASERRNPALPTTPATVEMLPGLYSETWFGMAAPPKTPSAIIDKLSKTVASILKQPDVTKQLLDMGNIEAIGSTPEQMASFMKREIERWGRVIRATGATADQ